MIFKIPKSFSSIPLEFRFEAPKFEFSAVENPQIYIFASKFKYFFNQNLDFVLGGAANGYSGDNRDPAKMPFLRISDVAEGSPAASAGLKDGDLVCGFGPIVRVDDRASGKSVREQCTEVLHTMARHIGSNKNVEMEVLIKRNGSMLDEPLKITPKEWSGEGVIGCRFHPLDANC